MILARLKEFADTQMKLPPVMYGEARIRWFIDIDAEGKLLGFVPLGNTNNRDKRGELFVVPTLVRAAGIKPKLLVDNAEYVLGIARETSNPTRVEQLHSAFVALTKACFTATHDPDVEAIVAFLETFNRDDLTLPEDFDASMNLSFRVHHDANTVIPADHSPANQSIQAFWADYTATGGDEDDRPIMTCLVTGERGPVEQRLPEKIKGIPGGQQSGTSLVSANVAAFESYGLRNSLTSPISRGAAEKFGKALNYLIQHDQHHIRLNPMVYVFWAKKPERVSLMTLLDNPNPEEVRNLLASANTGQVSHALDDAFYVLGLSASGGRTVVRTWLETTVPVVENNLRAWFAAQRIVDSFGQVAEPLNVYRLAAAAYRDAKKEMVPNTLKQLFETALQGTRLPEALLVKVINRNRAEGDVNSRRAALIKLILTSQGVEMDNMEALNPAPNLEGNDKAAYYCGRLLATLENAQRAALGDVNASLTDRYYGSAASTPSKVFAVLLRNSRAHLSKLRNERPTAGAAIDKRIEEVMAHLSTFPITLTMQQQGIFALGYYHQRADDRARAINAKAKRDAQTASAAEPDTSNEGA